MPISMDIGRLKDIQDWDDGTHEEEWHQVGGERFFPPMWRSRTLRQGSPTVKGKGKGESNGKGFDGARAEKWQWQGKGNRMGKGESKTVSRACYGCGEHARRVACCPKWKTFAIEQNEEVEAQEETVQVVGVCWDVECVEVKPKLKMTNRFAVLRLDGNLRCMCRSEIEGQAVGGDNGQWWRGECVASRVVARAHPR